MEILTLLFRDLSVQAAFVLVAFLGLCAIAIGVIAAARDSRQDSLYRHQEKMAEQQRLWRDEKLIESSARSRNRNAVERRQEG